MYLAIAIPREELGSRAEARNKEIKRCLSLGADYILMMDTDQAMPLNAVRMTDIENNDIVVVDAPSKDGQLDSHVQYHPDGTMAWTGFSCAVFKKDVFNRIDKPWFDSSVAYRFEIKAGKYVFTKEKKYKDDNFGEDVDFYFKCKDAGIKIKIADGPKCIHKEVE